MPEPCDYGHFVVRLDQRLVLVDGQPAALGGRAFDVLRVLLERSERVVTKEELMELVWPGVIVEENNLTVHISALRKLLGARVITTVAGRGYQFTPGSREAPARAAAATRSDAASTAGVATTASAVPRLSTRGRLLVAEDNRVNRLLLVRSLELLGHQVVAVDDGRKALEALRAQRFDLLLLDLGMPEMNGFDVLEAMAGDPELREVPVVVTSAVEAVEKVARCIELGADDYLHKPVDPVLLRARVASSLEKARLREQQRELIQRLMVADMGPGRGTAQTLAPGAASVTATVLAVKLRAVAGAAMALPASDVVGWLDECHTLWRDAIANHGGVTLGECGGTLLAVFGLASASAADPVVTTAPTTAQARLAAGFAGDAKSGKGVLEWPNGNRFVGDFAEDARSGLGIFYWRDGTVYQGQYAQDKMHGYGIKEQPDGAMELQRWQEGALQFGKPLLADARCSLTIDSQPWMFYSTQCINGLAHGQGLAVSLDGRLIVEEGRFVLGNLIEGEIRVLRLGES